MIRYPTRSDEIEYLVRMRQPGWQAKATERTNYHEQVHRFIKPNEILPNGKKATEFWGQVKDVFVTIQHSKCAYCETKLEASAIVWDLEHFRTKSNVTAWPYKGMSTGDAMPEGYYLLAYVLGNYVIACKTCNTSYKGTKFPIAHTRVKLGKTIADHASEGAYLIYPLGDDAEDPEQYITFDDVKAIAKNGSFRGQLIIDFFQLNREGLERQRAEWLLHTFWPNFEGAIDGKSKATKTMHWLLSHEAPYSNCTRAFYTLCLDDLAEGERRYAKMERILRKASGV